MVYIDFDGTVVDVWKRYHRVFLDAAGLSGIPLDDYIRIKRREQSDTRVAAYFHVGLASDYSRKKRLLLEDPDYLKLDELLLPREQLLSVFSKHACSILTLRRNAQAFYKELDWLGIASIRSKCIVLNPDHGIQKRDYLSRYGRHENDWVIGDSRAEAMAVGLPGTQVVLVRTGLQEPESLNISGSCEIVESLARFIRQYEEL